MDDLIRHGRLLRVQIRKHYDPGYETLPPEDQIGVAELQGWYEGVAAALQQKYGPQSPELMLWKKGLERIQKESWEEIGKAQAGGGYFVQRHLDESLGLLAQIKLLLLRDSDRETAIENDMQTEISDQYFDAVCMRFAVRAARQSVDEDERTHPRVGVVVAKNGEILAVAHRGETNAGDHAEFAALEKKLADDVVAGATVYTTLEPCTTRNHPKVPCVQRLIDRRIFRVVIGMVDPDPRIRGEGIRRLERARIAVDKFPLSLVEELLDLNRHFIRAKESEPSESKLPRKFEEIDESIDLLGVWYGAWRNPDGRTGEEVIHVLRREGSTFIGSFIDKRSPEAPIVFEGTLRKPYLRVQYHAPYNTSEGKGIMEDGSCFLKLQADGSFKGFYAGFDNYGEYELRRTSRGNSA